MSIINYHKQNNYAEIAHQKYKQYFAWFNQQVIQRRQRQDSCHRGKLRVYWCSFLLRHFCSQSWSWSGAYILLQIFFDFYQIVLALNYCTSSLRLRRIAKIQQKWHAQDLRIMDWENKILGKSHSLLGDRARTWPRSLYALVLPFAHQAHRQEQSRYFWRRRNLLFSPTPWDILIPEALQNYYNTQPQITQFS